MYSSNPSIHVYIKITYLMMARLGGDKPEVRLRRYEKCIDDLKEGEDYLARNDAKDLLELSGDALNRKNRKLLRTQKSIYTMACI